MLVVAAIAKPPLPRSDGGSTTFAVSLQSDAGCYLLWWSIPPVSDWCDWLPRKKLALGKPLLLRAKNMLAGLWNNCGYRRIPSGSTCCCWLPLLRISPCDGGPCGFRGGNSHSPQFSRLLSVSSKLQSRSISVRLPGLLPGYKGTLCPRYSASPENSADRARAIRRVES